MNPVNIPIKDMDTVKCEECECEVFTQGMMMRRASRFITGQPEDTIASVPVPICFKCGHINAEFIPPSKN